MTPSLLAADSISQQQNAPGFGSEAASNLDAGLERATALQRILDHAERLPRKPTNPRQQFLGAIDELTSLQFDLEKFDGEFQSTDELVAQLIRIRGTLAGIVRHVP